MTGEKIGASLVGDFPQAELDLTKFLADGAQLQGGYIGPVLATPTGEG